MIAIRVVCRGCLGIIAGVRERFESFSHALDDVASFLLQVIILELAQPVRMETTNHLVECLFDSLAARSLGNAQNLPMIFGLSVFERSLDCLAHFRVDVAVCVLRCARRSGGRALTALGLPVSRWLLSLRLISRHNDSGVEKAQQES